MSSTRPPREGARWGNDIQQALPEEPTVPAAYAKLCDDFGEPNVQRALQLREKIKNDYPHLAVLRLAPLDFAAGILRSARDSVQRAAADGRPHTMPETLNIMESILGNYFAANPSAGTAINITYGDENKGKAGKKKRGAAISVAAASGVFLLTLAGTKGQVTTAAIAASITYFIMAITL